MRRRAAIVVGVAAAAMIGGPAWAQPLELALTVDATCDGTVTARYDFDLTLGDSLTFGEATFTSGAVVDKQSLTDVINGSSGPQTETLTSAGWAVGDVVVVVFEFAFPGERSAAGSASVEIPECVVVTDPPVTDPPVTEPPPTDPPTTESPATEAPSTDPAVSAVPTTTPATVPPTLAVTGRDDTAPTGLVAAALAAAGAALVVFARRRTAD